MLFYMRVVAGSKYDRDSDYPDRFS